MFVNVRTNSVKTVRNIVLISDVGEVQPSCQSCGAHWSSLGKHFNLSLFIFLM